MSSNTKRFHPYSQNQNSSTVNDQKASKITSILKPRSVNTQVPASSDPKKKPTQSFPGAENYQFQAYLDGAIMSKNQNAYPTLMSNLVPSNDKSKLKKNQSINFNKSNSTNRKVDTATADLNKAETNCLKFLSGTTKSIPYYTRALETNNKNASSSLASSKPIVTSFVFEIIGSLDSTMSKNFNDNSIEFTIRDQFERLHCVFYEIDRNLDKIPRGIYLRCVGRYNTKTNLFNCVSVRSASQTEMFWHASYVNQTNSCIREKYLSSALKK